MNKKISLGLAVSLMAIVSAITFILTSFFSSKSFNEKFVDVNEKAKKYDSLQSIDTYVRQNFYGDIDETELNDGILKGYVAGLDDKYSRYLSADEFQTEQREDAGELIGLGLTLAEDESGYIRIVEVMPDSPVSDEGLAAGDIITKINNTDVTETGFEQAVSSMKGAEGTNITLTIRRDGVDTDYTFTRRAIEVTSVSGEMLDNYIGYIKITNFKQNTSQQFIELLERLVHNGAKGIIFDLRDNGGGLVSSLEDCLDPLLPEGVIAVADYKDEHSETIVYSDSSELNIPMIVLVNKNTASAAELFAASLRDFGKAELVGTKTYGKGVMQVTQPFETGGAVVLTVAEYRTVVSACYNGIGLTPDYIVENADKETDSQYETAIDLMYQKLYY